MSSPESDFELDAQLRAVPVPEGLVDRLRAAPWADDDDLDAAICDVPVAKDLVQRLWKAPMVDDEGLDEILRNLPVPTRLMASWRRRAKRRERLLWYAQLAVAASLLIALTLSYFSAMMWVHWPKRDDGAVARTEPKPAAKPDPNRLELSWGAGSAEKPSELTPLATSPEVRLAQVDLQRPVRTPAELGAGLNLPAWGDPLLVPSTGVLGSNSFDELAELPKRVADLVPRGLDWPLVQGSNRQFLIRYGFHPFVSPAAHPKLQTCSVPLAVDASSYELARRYVEDGQLPPPDLVRTVEVLAAMDYEYPKPARQELGLTMAAGPSPISGEGFCLLQIGVQARESGDTPHAPVHLVLVVDTSASMQWGSRIEGVRRALQELVTRLNPEDRLSLVSFNQAAHVLVEDLSPRDAKQFLAAVDSLSAEGSTDVGSGLREAFGLAQQMAGPDRLPVRVILLTDCLLELDRPWAERIERQVSEAAARGIPLHVIDMGQQRQGGADLAALAQLGHGTIHRATGFDQIRWAFRELVTGHSQLVAHDARLQVTFNPKTVLEYRLLGHEAKDWAGMMPGPLQADFRNGQSATAVYEVRLAPAGPNVPNDVAAAELTWSRPGEKNGEKGSQKATARLERKDVAVSLAAAPLWLQEAAVVAETAEALGRSPFLLLRTPHGSMTKALVRANELAGLVDSRVKQRPSFNDLIGLIQQSIKAKPSRSGGRKS